MSKEYFYSRNICCSEITEHPDHYLAKFVICDFSVNGNQVALNRDTIESWMSTLVGNPLVGKLVVAPKGELDFSGHNMKVVTRKDDDGNEYKTAEFDTDGEQKYFQLVYLFCSTSSDYKAQLDSVGVDWQKVSDFEMFRQLFIGNKNQDMSILLGDMDTSGFMMAKDNISGEIVLHNRLTDTRIDHVVYETISQYLCAANGIEKHSEFAADEPTRIAMIEEARDNLEYQKTKHYEPHLAELVLSMACSSGFKADYFKAMDYPMSVFMNHVRKIQQIKSYDNTMHGVYAGTVEFGKIPKAQLDWTSKVD